MAFWCHFFDWLQIGQSWWEDYDLPDGTLCVLVFFGSLTLLNIEMRYQLGYSEEGKKERKKKRKKKKKKKEVGNFLEFLAGWTYWILRRDNSFHIKKKEKKKKKTKKKKKRSVKFLGVSVLPICHLLYWTWMCSGWQQTWYCCCGAVMWYCQWEIMVRGAWQHPDAHLKAAIWWLHKHISTIHFLCISVLYVWLIFSDSELQVRRNPNTLRLVCKQASIKHSMTIKYCA